MKYIMFLIMALMLSASVTAENYPGHKPNWNSRHTVECSMVNNNTGDINYRFTHGFIDYAQAGSLMFFLQQGEAAWYAALRDQAENAGVDMQLFPLTKNQIKELIEIERIMSGKFDE